MSNSHKAIGVNGNQDGTSFDREGTHTDSYLSEGMIPLAKTTGVRSETKQVSSRVYFETPLPWPPECRCGSLLGVCVCGQVLPDRDHYLS